MRSERLRHDSYRDLRNNSSSRRNVYIPSLLDVPAQDPRRRSRLSTPPLRSSRRLSPLPSRRNDYYRGARRINRSSGIRRQAERDLPPFRVTGRWRCPLREP